MNCTRHVTDFEYPSPETLECPFPFYAALREEAPVHRLPTGEYLVSRWSDIIAVASAPEIYSNHIGPSNAGLPGDLGIDVDTSGRFTPWQMPFSDRPEHRLKRSLGLMLTTPDRMRSYPPLIHRHVDELIDGFCERGHAELVAEFADLLPTRVVNEIFGLQFHERPNSQATDASNPTVTNTGVGTRLASDEHKARMKAAAVRRAMYYRQAILDRAANPTDDFTSVIVKAKLERDGELDLGYLTVELMNFHGAGIFTTAHMLASTLLLLLQHPDEMQRLRADPSRAGPVIDETLRLESPVQWLQRITLQDSEIAGAKVPKGAVLLLVWAAANRDDAKFPEADRFWPDRPGKIGDRISGQLAFGHGVHTCLGAPVARLEGKIALNRLLERLPNLRLSDQNDYKHILDNNHRAPRAVHVDFDVSRGYSSAPAAAAGATG
jgi:cytochrome P450